MVSEGWAGWEVVPPGAPAAGPHIGASGPGPAGRRATEGAEKDVPEAPLPSALVCSLSPESLSWFKEGGELSCAGPLGA